MHAYPLHWHGQVLGAFNVFYERELSPQTDELGQAFADVATLVLVTPTHLSIPTLASLVDAALSGRTVIEQAKGVLAYQLTVTTEKAYSILLRRARDTGSSVTATAQDIVKGAYSS